MLQTLIFLTLKQWKAHKLRLAFTLFGISLGVAVFFAIRTANITLLGSLNQTIEKLAGKATLQVTANESGVPEEVLDIVRNTPGIEIAEPAIEVIASTAFENSSKVMIVGMDATGNQELHEYEFDQSQTEIGDPLVYLSEPFSILVSRKFAEKHHLKEDDKLPLFTSQGKKEFTVRGVFEPIGIGEVFDGQVATMDVYSAQFVFNRGRTFDRIDIMTDPNTPLEEVINRLRKQLPPAIEVGRPSSRSQGIENATTAMRYGMTITSFIALLVGVFIIFNSLMVSVNQRWKEIGILRSLGVERSNIIKMFLCEALLLGTLGSTIGVIIGFFLAIIATKLVSNIVSSIYGFVSSTESITFRIDYALLSIGIGITSSLIAALIPARSASQLNPILALHNIEIRQQKVAAGWTRMILGVITTLIALLLIALSPPKVGMNGQFLYLAIMLVGLILMLPKFSSLTAAALRPIMNFLFGLEGTLSVDAIKQAPSRTTATVGALMIGLMFVFATAAYVYSYKATLVRWMDKGINSDLIVKSTSDMARSRTYHFSEDLSKQIAALPEVKRIENVRFTSIPYQKDTAVVITIEMDGWFERTNDFLEEGDEQKARELMPKGNGVVVSKNFAMRWGSKVGDILQLETPKGLFERPILGIKEDYTSEKGTIIMDRALYIKYWQDSAVDFIDINLKSGVDSSQFKQKLEKLLAGQQQAFVYTSKEYKQWIIKLIDGFFALNYMQMAIAMIVAIIGIFNTISISVLERQRELGIIRAIGGLRSQIRKMILLEAVVLSISGLIAGSLAGLLNTYFLIHTAAIILAGFTIPFKFPISMVIVAIPIVIIIAIAAAWWPAQRSVNLNVVESIGYE